MRRFSAHVWKFTLWNFEGWAKTKLMMDDDDDDDDDDDEEEEEEQEDWGGTR